MAKYGIKDGVGIIPEGTAKIEGEYDILYHESPFEDCTRLINIVIPDSVTEIGCYAFDGCTSLTNIIIPNSVTKIGDFAFSGCTSLTTIIIPNSVTKIGDDAFNGCTSLKNIVIPESVIEIGNNPFYNCESLTSIAVSEKNKVYDSRDNSNAIIETESNTLIAGCKNTVIPNSVTEIGYRAFYGCTGLTSIVFPDSVTEIGRTAFCDCTSLTTIIIPDSVTKIGDYTFRDCTGLTDIVISNAVTEIIPSAFSNCSGLRRIAVKEGNPRYDSRSNCNAIIETANNELILGCKSTIIPDSVTKISDSALQLSTGLTSLIFPQRLRRSYHRLSEIEEVGIYRRYSTKGTQIYIKEEGSLPRTISEYKSNYDVDGDDAYMADEQDMEEHATYVKFDELDNINSLSKPSERKSKAKKRR